MFAPPGYPSVTGLQPPVDPGQWPPETSPPGVEPPVIGPPVTPPVAGTPTPPPDLPFEELPLTRDDALTGAGPGDGGPGSGGGQGGDDPPASGIPEPAAWVELILGAGIAGALLRRARRGQPPTALRARSRA
jgi:hypothetical protein